MPQWTSNCAIKLRGMQNYRHVHLLQGEEQQELEQ